MREGQSVSKRLLNCLVATTLLSTWLIAGCKRDATSTKTEEGTTTEVVKTTITINTEKKNRYFEHENTGWNLEHLTLEVEPNWAEQTLKGDAMLVAYPVGYETDSIVLNAKAFDIYQIDWRLFNKGVKYASITDFKYDNQRLVIYFPSKIAPKQRVEIAITYTANPMRQYELKLIDNRRAQGLYFINPKGVKEGPMRQMWTQGEPQNNSAWFPTVDNPTQKYTQTMYVTIDTGLVSVANGVLESSTFNKAGTKTDKWVLDQQHPTYLTALAIGSWVPVKDTWRDSIPVTYWVEPRYKAGAKMVWGKTPKMMEYFSKKLQYPFPWPKYDQVALREFVSGAMENTTVVLFYGALHQDNAMNADESQDDIIAHELSHHWFGDLVTARLWPHLSVNESFASFCEILWKMEMEPENVKWDVMEKVTRHFQEVQPNVEQPLVQMNFEDPGDVFDTHRYKKGGVLLYKLLQLLGEKVFLEGVNGFLKKHAYGTATVYDLQRSLEDACGKDLSVFFKENFLSPKTPEVEAGVPIYDDARGKWGLPLTQKYSTVDETPFHITTSVEVFYADSLPATLPLKLDKYRDTLWLKSKRPPVVTLLNPGYQDLVRVTGEETDSLSKHLTILKQSASPQAQYQAAIKLFRATKYSLKKVPASEWNAINNVILRPECEPMLLQLYARFLARHADELGGKVLLPAAEKVYTILGKNPASNTITALTPIIVRSIIFDFLETADRGRASDLPAYLKESAYPKRYFALLYKHLNHPSYSVQEAAFNSLYANKQFQNQADEMAAFEKLSKCPDPSILSGLGYYVNTIDSSGKYIKFFHDNLSIMESSNLAIWTKTYTDYLLKCPGMYLMDEADFVLSISGIFLYDGTAGPYVELLNKMKDKLSTGKVEGKVLNEVDALVKKLEKKVLEMEPVSKRKSRG